MAKNENEDKWCFAWFAGANEARRKRDARTKAGLVRDAKWPPRAVITIAFLDGTDEQKGLVRKYAEEWVTKLANLTFSWIADPKKAHIRISFRHKGSWSTVGMTCKKVKPKTKATMNFGWLTPSVTAAEARRVVLHEFGHALGLIHEHQSPIDPIEWDRDAVIADLSGPPNRWGLATIERNMFKSYALHQINGTPVDRDSIMMYPIPASWTKGTFSSGLNKELSRRDRSFIRQQYR